MSYQTQVAVTTAPPPRRPISKWWWIGLLIAWIIFVAIGGGLIGASSSFYSCLDNYYATTCYGNDSLAYGAYACFAIGGILHLAYWIVLSVWLTQRRRWRAAVNGPIAESATAYKPFPPQPPTATNIPLPTYASPPQGPDSTISTSSENQATVRGFCGNCGATISTRFCTQCGAQA